MNHPKSENSGVQDSLSAGQRSSLKSAHRMERDRKIGERIKVVLLADQGESFAQIARFLFIDEQKTTSTMTKQADQVEVPWAS